MQVEFAGCIFCTLVSRFPRWACWVVPSLLCKAARPCRQKQNTEVDDMVIFGWSRYCFSKSFIYFPRLDLSLSSIHTVYRICAAPTTLQISHLTSVIDSHQSVDRSSFTNDSVRMKGAYFTPAQQHLLNIFCLFRQIFPPAYAKHLGHVVLENTHSPRWKMASIKASWFFTACCGETEME